MKKIAVLIILLLFHPLFIQALEIGDPFVVLDGKVYQVLEEQVDNSEIRQEIGQVTAESNDISRFYGNASNIYPVGTKYYQIKQTDITEAIAVYDGNDYWKAVFAEAVPFHWKNLFINSIPYLFLLSLVILYVVREEYKKRLMENSDF
ncbi:hypothetical protein F9U64_01990 [Gracilibacillus oryzae]|uniref:Uncharacterized protein n=1 Tax=Gracilibacillus oryzae TaxID=1672701 RepID=A0A7C8GVJ5_9BACI|nr:hypothetical protein [Gracilibacillus oryzae]KAB8139183.1 hypothetical protein F9U64_01990 [Gracilibacillus oryzae]